MIEELIADRYKALMSKDKANKKKMFVNCIKYYNKALKRTKVVDTIFKLHSKISGATLSFDTSVDAIKEAIENFKTLMTSYTDDDDTLGFLKNISDLYLKLAKKDKDNKKEYLKQAVKYANDFLKKVNPRIKEAINFQLGTIHKMMGQNSKALSYFLKIEKESFASRKLEFALFQVALCYENMKKYPEALKVVNRLYTNFPNFDLCFKNAKKKDTGNPKDSIVYHMIQRLKGKNAKLDVNLKGMETDMEVEAECPIMDLDCQ